MTLVLTVADGCDGGRPLTFDSSPNGVRCASRMRRFRRALGSEKLLRVAETDDPRAWAASTWPSFGWEQSDVLSGAFHDVLVCRPDVAARIADGDGHRQRTHREAGILRICVDLDLPYLLPQPLGEPVSRLSRTGLLTTFVPGHVIPTAGWSDVRDTFAAALDSFKQVPPDRAAGLPATRSWCGAESWPAIVQDQLGRHLPAPELHVAVHVVTDVLATFDSSDARFVHGDFGLHNMLWSDGRLGGLIDLDHACWSDPAMDLAPLIGIFGARRVAEIASAAEIDRALYHRASLSLQVAAAAELVGDYPLRDHALRNFRTRLAAGTLYDPDRKKPGM